MKENDVLKMLMALTALSKPRREFILIGSGIKFGMSFLFFCKMAQEKTVLLLTSDYTDTPSFSPF